MCSIIAHKSRKNDATQIDCLYWWRQYGEGYYSWIIEQGYPAEQIIVNDPNKEKRAFFANLGVATSENNVESATNAEVVLLAVKPQMMTEVCLPLSAVDFSDKLLISIAAGISTERLNALIPSIKSIVRVMPNTPALVGEGMAGLFAPKKYE